MFIFTSMIHTFKLASYWYDVLVEYKLYRALINNNQIRVRITLSSVSYFLAQIVV